MAAPARVAVALAVAVLLIDVVAAAAAVAVEAAVVLVAATVGVSSPPLQALTINIADTASAAVNPCNFIHLLKFK